MCRLILRNGQDQCVPGVTLDRNFGTPFLSMFPGSGERFATIYELATLAEPQDVLVEHREPGCVQLFRVRALKEGETIILDLQQPVPDYRQEATPESHCLWLLA